MQAETVILYRKRITGEAFVRFYAPEELPDGRRLLHAFLESTFLVDHVPGLVASFGEREGYLVEEIK